MFKLISLLAILALIGSCKSTSVENLRSGSDTIPAGEARLSDGTGPKGGKIADEDELYPDDDLGESDEEQEHEQEDLDPDATPDDHDHVDLDSCFQKMPKDRDPGPFFREDKVVEGWGRNRREVTVKVPIAPPPPGLSICKTIMDECIICEAWEIIDADAVNDEQACDAHAAACTSELARECRCVRS